MRKERKPKVIQKGINNLFEPSVKKTKNGYQLEFFVLAGDIKRPMGAPQLLKTEKEVAQKTESFGSILKGDFKICNACLGFGNVTDYKKFVVDKNHGDNCTCPRCKGMGIKMKK
ncbi:MAG: hypothetical protein US30_C0022G0015 [Candidatus Moranbacteria bacterium GW2011_GWF2_36_839]|nr:MAG: hypothetical protein US30_C0022G0015 [Candidatus Moranbacteria bacterium GW2011_GWF2_36_839]